MKRVLFLLLLGSAHSIFAFSWSDLWFTKNQQAQELMKDGQFKQAETTFQQPDWRAAAAYRAGDYKQAAAQYQTLSTETAYYNQGNALAHLGQYEQAIKAYNKALALNPNNKDALYNRKLLEELLNKNQQNKDQQNQNQQDKDQQNQNQQGKDQQDQNQQSKDQQNQNQQGKDQQNQNQQGKDQQNQNQQGKDQQDQNQQGKDQQDQNQQGKDQQDQNQQGKDQQDQNQQGKDQQDQNQQGKDQQDQNQQGKDQQDQNQQGKDQQDQNQQNKEQTNQDKQSQDAEEAKNSEELEKQQAKDQWLRLIPDDPGGLMREKFLRDHLRREGGWYQ
ncbi:putative O-linked N-acetylglucosamine transferase, SPINDLY family [Legionella massiliensis]|uniref:Putative O-linked N-acetylglucosamine transferase, SPINDLY family n=1 Tax=Legionella massiliensis TaxID=1034943 RepID=A0A078KSG3_9GAMM|nr:tetratricopeptide repeat protein [Legionella massiliensis]CDZ76001.1 putative O-linked N-acetylglucosamine transferase, SPINDLY family [Legionella massiliensis]CEE11739.1 Tetratricopeptide repeat protein [Legionella massiliensis]